MSTIAFDTLKFAKKLEAAGLPAAQAISEAFRDATGEEPVTKDYLDARLESAKNDIIKWVAGRVIRGQRGE